MRSPRIRQFSQSLQFSLFIVLAAFFSPLAAEPVPDWSVAVGSASAMPGDMVEIPIELRAGSARISAIAFSIDYDDTRLILAGDPAAGSKVDIPAPDRFTASSWLSSSGPAIGIAVYDRQRPIETLPDGPLARLRFRVRGDASGFAPITIRAGSLSASSPEGRVIGGAVVVSGGVSLNSPLPRLHVSPRSLHFGPVRLGSLETRTAIVTNPGSGNLTVTRVSIEGSADFTVAGELSQPIPSGGSRALEVTFIPTGRGETIGRLVVESREAGSASIELLGAGSEGELYFDRELIVPAIAALRHQDGSRWASSLQMYNSGSSPVSARLRLLRAGSSASEETEISLEAGESIGWQDIAADLFQQEEVSGAVRISATSDTLVVRSATYRERPDGGQIAQSVPVIAREDLFRPGEEARLIGLARNEHRRTNVTVMNFGSETATLTVELRDAGGSLLNTLHVTLEPEEIAPVIPILDALSADAGDLVILVRSASPGAEFFVYSSTVDQRTGAPLFQSPR